MSVCQCYGYKRSTSLIKPYTWCVELSGSNSSVDYWSESEVHEFYSNRDHQMPLEQTTREI